MIAIFGQSQLHCLGLAMFLARAQHDGLGFIILDDPVLSSDEDFRSPDCLGRAPASAQGSPPSPIWQKAPP